MSRDRDRSVIAAAVERAVQTTPVPTIRAATVAQPPASNGTVSVLIDGDTAPSQCEIIGFSTLTAGDRVTVMFFPPHGAYVLGQVGGTASSGIDPTMGGDLSGLASNAQINAGVVDTTELADDGVTYAKMQETSAPEVLLGRGEGGGAGDVEEITLGAGLTMTGTTLSSSAVDAAISWLPLMPLLS